MDESDVVVRTLTIIIKFDEKNRPDWIWDCHKNQSFVNGVFITAIAEGNQIGKDECCEGCCESHEEF